MDDSIKIIFAGDSNAGKTSVLLRYINGPIQNEVKPTIAAAFFTKEFVFKEKSYKLVLWDTAGQEKYRNLTPMYYRGSNIAFILFDITSKETFDHLDSWIHDVRNEAGDGVQITIVGNKIDLENRAITHLQAQDFATSIGAQYFETSAITGEGVQAMMQYTIEYCIPRMKLEETNSKAILLNDSNNKSGCC